MKTLTYLVIGVAAIALTSCSGNSNEPDGSDLSAKEQTLKAVAEDYVDHTVIPTYSKMADASIELQDLCHKMRDKFANGTLTESDVEKAGKTWKESRKYWELSEAFLYGPAGNHNIDPHIDSWPLDKAAMNNLLADIRAGKSWSLENNGGYGLIGFHSVEYLLFELTEDENSSRIHSLNYTAEELEYLCAVADDLCQQCVCLEACWAGTDNVSSAKQAILEEAELDYNEQYGWEMKNARQAGSRYKTYQEVAEEILQGCIDIADEVGNTKIGRPLSGSSDEDKNYIESPYSLNSIEDFADNIHSIENSYFGSVAGDACLSDYIKSVNPELDSKLRDAINKAIKAIEDIPEPFAKNSTNNPLAATASEACSYLVDVLEETVAQVNKN